MKPYFLLSLLFLSIISIPSKSSALNPNAPELSSLLDPADADRILLIVFPDQSINRIQGTALSMSYRRRGAYQSSTWSRQITGQIAEDYHLEKLTEWPMTEIGMHCAVYQVPVNASVPDIMQRLSQDSRASIVQKMHLFKTRGHQYNDPYFKLQSNLQLMQIDQVHGKTTGRNITIAMIDTGVDIVHPDLIG
jgi:phage-related protein